MKIALIGTHGVGKTTLCFDLAARLKRIDRGVQLVTEIARECPLPINRDTTLGAQSWILHTQCARELAAAGTDDVIVCDRSILDNYAYLVHAVGRREDLDPWIREWTRTYDALFKVPLWQQPSFDGTRDTDVGFQREIDATIDRLVEELDVSVCALRADNPYDWVDAIFTHLALPKMPKQPRLFP